ncbi:GntR family transcriptional regulator [Sphingorhabdus sp.]|uniref:GntR family transcriptional regulator n=1 Tax=Sphingorhabdus sp. TaxID=1902408 RepID=UPI0032B79496
MSERSTTENMFLEVRFAVLSGIYLPGQILDRDELCQVYGCKSATALDALNALVHEGYLDIPRRGVFGVRLWSEVEINDLFDIRASMMGMAAARATERGTDLEVANLVRRTEEAAAPDFSDQSGTEILISRGVDIQATIIRMARVATITDMARSIGPNALYRQSVWAQNSKQLIKTWRSIGAISAALKRRAPAQAQSAMAEFVELTRGALLASFAEGDHVDWPEFPVIRRIDCHIIRRGCAFGAGGREPALDGRIIPFGIGQLRS